MRIAQTNQLGVDHRLPDPHVGEQPAPAIARPHVELEPDATAFDESAVDRGCLAAGGMPALADLSQSRGGSAALLLAQLKGE